MKLYSDGQFLCNPKINLIGEHINELTILERAPDLISPTSGRRFPAWVCQCDCGNTIIAPTDNIRDGSTKHCNSVKHRPIFNKYDLSGEYGIGYTNNADPKGRNYFYFDKEQYDIIKYYGWHFESRTGYVVCKRESTIRLHRLVMDINNENLYVDHINHNRYDNRKTNLRIVTKSQNNMNKTPVPNKSGCTGVYWDNDRNRWSSYIKIGNKNKRIGRYLDIEDAIEARKKAENEYFGEYSYDNSMALASII